MAKSYSYATLITLLCFFFTLSAAHTSPQNRDATAAPHSQSTTALRLPSDTPTHTNAVLQVTQTPFHLVNHRFPARSKKPCRHRGKILPAATENGMITYGNDMLVASGESSDFQNPVIHGEESWVPRRWVRMRRRRHHHHHHHDEDSDSDSDDEEEDRADQKKKEKKKTIVSKRYDLDRYGGGEDQILEKVNKEEKKEGCLFKRLRKFLDHYFY